MHWSRDKTVAFIMGAATVIIIVALVMAGVGLEPMRIRVIQLEPELDVKEKVINP